MGKLTNTQVKNAKQQSKPYKLSDGDGMYLFVTKAGKYFRYDYRFLGSRKTLALGVYPAVTLKKARKRLAEAREKLEEGIDPGHLRKMTKASKFEAAENCFEKFALEWFAKQNWTEGHARTVKSRLSNNILPYIGDRPVNEITAQDVLTVCQRVEDRGAIETAHRIKTICSQVFRYCVASGLIKGDPCRDLRQALTPASPKRMATITEPEKIGDLMRAIHGYKGAAVTRAALLLAPLVFVRPGELRKAEWEELDFDSAQWKIPAEKMKMRQPHIVPLSKQAFSIIKDLQPLTGNGKYLFPSIRSAARPMSENTVNGALRRLGYTKEELTGHGFRSMASTLLHEMQWPSQIVERQLAHKDSNSVRDIYNYAEYLNERREMMQFWSDYLYELKAKKPGESEVKNDDE